MAGENLQPRSRARPSRQPGGRRPAPGTLALVQAFINTHYDLERDHGAELLSTPGALGDWLTHRGLLTNSARLGDRDLRRALPGRRSGVGARSPQPSGGRSDRGASLYAGRPSLPRASRRGPRLGARGAAGRRGSGDGGRQLEAHEDLPRRGLWLGVLRPLAQSSRALVLDVGLRRSRQGAEPLPPAARRGALRSARWRRPWPWLSLALGGDPHAGCCPLSAWLWPRHSPARLLPKG